MAKTIGTYEARTHWSEVIQEVRKGEHFVITHHGEPIAELVPPRPISLYTSHASSIRRA
jgi:prevent-host-death family protein